MKSRIRILLAVAALAAPLAAAALDAPHDASFDSGDCSNCHSLFASTASGAKVHTAGCLACHNKDSHQNGPSGFPWYTEQQATPGLQGDQHNWSGPAANPRFGTRSPSNLALVNQMPDGNIQCTVCHDVHRANPTLAPDSQQTSIPVGVAVGYHGGPTSTGTMTLVTSGSAAKGYRVKIQTWSGAAGTFVLSHDFGALTPTWLNYVGGAWVPGTEAGPGFPFTTGAAVPLNDPAVTVQFGGAGAVGNYWDFYVAYPFLRVSNVNDAMCKLCHVERFQNDVRGGGRDPIAKPNGVRKFSHPVEVALGQNGRGYDAPSQAGIVDADGTLQGAGDGNGSNDLVLRGGMVRCTTCHAVHNADSNSLTKDAR